MSNNAASEKELLAGKIRDLEKRCDDIRKRITPLQEELSNVFQALKSAKNYYYAEVIKEIEESCSSWEKVSFYIENVSEMDGVKDIYENRNKVFKNILGLRAEGYLRETDQSGIVISINPRFSDDQLNIVKDNIEKMLLILRPTSELNGKIFTIFDNDLSYSHHYILVISDKIKIIDTYHHSDKGHEFATIIDALKWIRKNAYYGDYDESDEEDA